MMVVKRLGHAIEVSCGGKYDKHVEDLVGVAPDIECARIASLGPTSLASTSPKSEESYMRGARVDGER
jgi:hypothetical protein